MATIGVKMLIEATHWIIEYEEAQEAQWQATPLGVVACAEAYRAHFTVRESESASARMKHKTALSVSSPQSIGATVKRCGSVAVEYEYCITQCGSLDRREPVADRRQLRVIRHLRAAQTYEYFELVKGDDFNFGGKSEGEARETHSTTRMGLVNVRARECKTWMRNVNV